MSLKKSLLVLAIPALLTACFDDSAKKCASLSQKGDKDAFEVCEKAAETGNAQAQYHYAQLLLEANKTEQAVTFLEKSSKQKNAAALVSLGEIYEQGKLGETDWEKAALYYKKGCDLDDIKGCELILSLNKKIKVENERRLQEAKEKEEARLKEEARVAEEQRVAREKELQRLAEERKLEEAKQELEAEKKRLEAEKQRLDAQRSGEPMMRAEPQYRSESVSPPAPTTTKVDTTGLQFFDGLAVFQENGWYGFVNSSGNVVITPQFRYAGRFSRGRSAVQANNGLWGFIDTKGEYVVAPNHCALAAFSESDGLAGVYDGGYKSGDKCTGGKWGFMDTNGRWVIEPVLDHAERFVKGKAKVTYNGRTGYVNRYGQWIN